MSKCVTMYGENKPSTLINDDHERPNFFRAIPVRSAMPNIKLSLNYFITKVLNGIKILKNN